MKVNSKLLIVDYFKCFYIFISKLKKLSEDSLTKQPEEVFDVLEKLGEGYVQFCMCRDIWMAREN